MFYLIIRSPLCAFIIVKLSDLGLACKIKDTGAIGLCGTRGFWAPDMLRKDADGKRFRYTKSVDWFSLGCCIFVFLSGQNPFCSQAVEWNTKRQKSNADLKKLDVMDEVIDLATMEMEPEFDPAFFGRDATDLIKKLLDKDGSTRLGAKGYKEIMEHPWFSEIDWVSEYKHYFGFGYCIFCL